MIFLAIQGIRYLRPDLIWTNPQVGFTQNETGGFLDPLIGTILVAGIAIAHRGPGRRRRRGLAERVRAPGGDLPAWSSRPSRCSRARPRSCWRCSGSCCSRPRRSAFCRRPTRASCSASRSSPPGRCCRWWRCRWSSRPCARGCRRSPTTSARRRTPSARPRARRSGACCCRRPGRPSSPATCSAIGHVIGDTAIIVLLLGDTQTLQGVGHVPLLGTLRGTGSTLTSYIFDNAPTGDLNQPNKAYAAAFVLLLIILVAEPRRRRLRAPMQGSCDGAEKAAAGPAPGPGWRGVTPRPAPQDQPALALARRHERQPAPISRPRVRVRPPTGAQPGADGRAHAGGGAVDRLRLKAGRQLGLASDPPGRGAGADRAVRVRQDDAAALAQPAHRADQDSVAERADHARRGRHRRRSSRPRCGAG